jgi:hypothetical protein
MLWRRYDVFLSYSRSDTERVQPLLNVLRAQGYRVFFDVQSIDPGQPWKRRLERAIRASRALVLCWSEQGRASDYITFEYSRAEALGKPVYPWLLDATPLPAMLELQGIAAPDGERVAQVLRPYLGWTLARRRLLLTLVLTAVLTVLGAGLWRGLHPPPPPPWQFEGVVTDNIEQMPLGGVEVDMETDDGRKQSAWTDAQGRYRVLLPLPRPDTIGIRFRKQGYQAEANINVNSSRPFNMIMIREKHP